MAAEERIYQQRVGPARTTPLPYASAESYGAGVGEAMGQLGDTIHRGQIQNFQIEKRQEADQQLADFSAKFAEARLAADKASIDARNTAQPGAAGHAKAMDDWWSGQAEQLTQGITNSHVLRAAKQQIVEFGARFAGSEYQYEAGARVGKLVTDTQSASDLAANRARLAHDPKSFAEELTLGRQSIDALQGVPADVKEKLVRHHDETVTVGYLNGLNDTNPKAAIALLDAGAFNDILTPQQVEQARGGATVEVRRLDAAAAHQQALQTAALRDQVQTAETRISAGVQVPDGQLAGLQAQLQAIGDQGGATKIGVLRVKGGVIREADVWRPEQFDSEINRLAGLKSRSPEQDIRLKALRDMRGSAVATFNNNPGEWAAKNGMPPPVLNLSDPAAIAARSSWQRAVGAEAGRPVPFFTGAEASALRAQATASPKGRLDVANQISAIGGYGVLQAARQIAPNDPMLGRLALLPPESRVAATNGIEARKARPDLVDGAAGKMARDAFLSRVGVAASLLSQSDLNAAFEASRNLYADWAGRHGAQDYDDKDYAQFVHQALGGTRGPNGEKLGGLGSWNRQSVLLPPTMTDDRFNRTLARLQYRPDTPNAPVWHDGQAMTPDQLRRYVPVQRPDGLYEFHGPNDTVVTVKGGRTWTLNIERLAKDLGL
jgi:hypothetical protein